MLPPKFAKFSTGSDVQIDALQAYLRKLFRLFVANRLDVSPLDVCTDFADLWFEESFWILKSHHDSLPSKKRIWK